MTAESSVPRSGKRCWPIRQQGLLLLRNTDDFPKKPPLAAILFGGKSSVPPRC